VTLGYVREIAIYFGSVKSETRYYPGDDGLWCGIAFEDVGRTVRDLNVKEACRLLGITSSAAKSASQYENAAGVFRPTNARSRQG
jgi:hypothetical protein